MKKKITAICLCVAMLAIAIVGATLAYFTDTDAKTNVFTTGDVSIDLIETFDENNAMLMPGKDITKEVDITNDGSQPAYVRAHIAIPAILDSGSEDEPAFAAYNNTLHWNFTGNSLAEGLWNWNSDKDGANYPGNGGTWNMYQTKIDNVMYNVYVATYETALQPEKTTSEHAINKVYLDVKVTNEIMTEITRELGTIKVLVAVEGGQVEGFDNAYDALNTQFGVPGTYSVNWEPEA